MSEKIIVKFAANLSKAIGITKDESIINLTNNRIEFFSIERFKKDIAEGNCCFICGSKSEDKEFNDEHVIPDWILRKFNLHNNEIFLPNGTTYKYANLKIPCCKDCNTEMGNLLEIPLSNLFTNGYDGFIKYLENYGPGILHNWLYLLFIKIHLKHKDLRLFQDKRKPSYRISDLTDWESLHHIHCMARTFYTNPTIKENVWGTLLVLKAKEDNNKINFDYGDSFQGKGIFIRINNVCIIAILNDSFISINYLNHFFQKINAPLSAIQIREFFSRLVHVNMNLTERPIFRSSYNDNNDYSIQVEMPKKIDKFLTEKFPLGDIYYNFCSEMILNSELPNKEYILQKIKEGKWSFLLNEKEEFIEY